MLNDGTSSSHRSQIRGTPQWLLWKKFQAVGAVILPVAIEGWSLTYLASLCTIDHRVLLWNSDCMVMKVAMRLTG